MSLPATRHVPPDALRVPETGPAGRQNPEGRRAGGWGQGWVARTGRDRRREGPLPGPASLRGLRPRHRGGGAPSEVGGTRDARYAAREPHARARTRARAHTHTAGTASARTAPRVSAPPSLCRTPVAGMRHVSRSCRSRRILGLHRALADGSGGMSTGRGGGGHVTSRARDVTQGTRPSKEQGEGRAPRALLAPARTRERPPAAAVSEPRWSRDQIGGVSSQGGGGSHPLPSLTGEVDVTLQGRGSAT